MVIMVMKMLTVNDLTASTSSHCHHEIAKLPLVFSSPNDHQSNNLNDNDDHWIDLLLINQQTDWIVSISKY